MRREGPPPTFIGRNPPVSSAMAREAPPRGLRLKPHNGVRYPPPSLAFPLVLCLTVRRSRWAGAREAHAHQGGRGFSVFPGD